MTESFPVGATLPNPAGDGKLTSVQMSFMELLFPSEPTQATLGQPLPHRPVARRAVRISASILQRYTGLSEIAPGEWLTYFPNTGKPWKQRDLKYLAEWWGKDDVLSLAYALGRPPWGLQREICKMRRQGVEIAYQRVDKPRERELEYAR
ncbi:hypothetical protein [Alicyclobacillus sp. ALC3]|uniref:hypothetical protein n=1 Tax=Alicyclobacillus sp. ALC3 TaxID=2796143 RepID=UPI002378105E|nr:hypothetical protein [Alicyclobacillus sp. ALC3]WDL97827.1 hypothetical protein JC200_03590 [Alicyclobacillus sp. ALC3]